MVVQQLRELRLGPLVLPQIYRDVDDFSDAVIVAGEAPCSRFADALTSLLHRDRSTRFDAYRSGVDRSGSLRTRTQRT
jgi:hypothetical protein